MDDFLVFGPDRAGLNRNLELVLTRLVKAGTILVSSKSDFVEGSAGFLGPILSSTGITAEA